MLNIFTHNPRGCESGLPHKLQSRHDGILKDLIFLFYLRSILKIKSNQELSSPPPPPTQVDFIFSKRKKQTQTSWDIDACAGPSELAWQSISHFPLQLCLPDATMRSLSVPSVGALGGDERCVEDTLTHLCQCPHSQSDFKGQVKKYWGLICKQRLSLKLGRQVDSKQLYV